MTAAKAPPKFRVGDRVSFVWGVRRIRATIIEERGPLGHRGQHVYRIRIDVDPDEPVSFEVPEDYLQPVDPAEEFAPLPKDKVLEYLKVGALVSMLYANRGGGKAQPRAWLCRNNLDDVTYTFVPERGVIGGQTVPAGAFYDHKVFTPKRDEVAAFVQSFGLTPAEAQEVIRAVGTAP